MSKKVTMVLGANFGSEAKGLICGYLAEQNGYDCAVTAWTPSAGHTHINAEGRKWVHTQLALSIVSPNMKTVLIGPGSVVHLDNLVAEVLGSIDIIREKRIRICIHPHAAMVMDYHRTKEQLSMVGIGSTQKGGGAAIAEKIARQPGGRIVAKDFIRDITRAAEMAGDLPIEVVSGVEYESLLHNAKNVICEGAQGYSLGINSGFYPYVTSRECTPAQMASDCLIAIPDIKQVVAVMRTHPIRVAHRYNAAGGKIGDSGPCYWDQQETNFESLGQEQELTTVTKLPRRIFTFSDEQCARAMNLIRPDAVALTFANYARDGQLRDIRDSINASARAYNCGGVRYLGTGPTAADITEVLA